MNTTLQAAGRPAQATGQRAKQWIKLVVYSLLLINFGLYIIDDLVIASHTRHDGWTVLDWSAAFATSIDELAWFILLFLFELETYLLADEAFTRKRVALMHGLRIICYLFLAHTVFAYTDAIADLSGLEPIEDITDLCQLTEEELSFGSNLEYTALDAGNCNTLSSDTQLYLIEEGTVVTDSQGLQIERELAWIDLAEALVWLGILLLIELMVRMQDRGISSGPGLTLIARTKLALYGLLWLAAAYWAYRGHWMFSWDEALWILGFMAIDMNLSDWRKEIELEES